MARSYWEHWDRELHVRKKAFRKCKNHQITVPCLFEIDYSLLHDPHCAAIILDVFLVQGSFAVIKLKLFRGIQVAVKELQPRTLLADVTRRLIF